MQRPVQESPPAKCCGMAWKLMRRPCLFTPLQFCRATVSHPLLRTPGGCSDSLRGPQQPRRFRRVPGPRPCARPPLPASLHRPTAMQAAAAPGQRPQPRKRLASWGLRRTGWCGPCKTAPCLSRLCCGRGARALPCCCPAAAPPPRRRSASPSPPTGGSAKKSSSKTVTDTVIGEHEHTIVGYSLVKGIGDGEPIARWVLGSAAWAQVATVAPPPPPLTAAAPRLPPPAASGLCGGRPRVGAAVLPRRQAQLL